MFNLPVSLQENDAPLISLVAQNISLIPVNMQIIGHHQTPTPIPGKLVSRFLYLHLD